MAFIDVLPGLHVDERLVAAGYAVPSHDSPAAHPIHRYHTAQSRSFLLCCTEDNSTEAIAFGDLGVLTAIIPPDTLLTPSITAVSIERLSTRPITKPHGNDPLALHMYRRSSTPEQWLVPFESATEATARSLTRLSRLFTKDRRHLPEALTAIGNCGPYSNFRAATLWADEEGIPFAISAAPQSRRVHMLGSILVRGTGGAWMDHMGCPVGVLRPRWLRRSIAANLFTPEVLDL